ncbi:uncharacterized protein BXZ73DRAFT_100700 [Epithele typhae]|uniref:uncharacterized protein n=1 Tax=Epithele typhae TaxID=378194 RepID=UPI0020082976|nr:uncharacterized protein BXZ73DRAFT_100700 [Epithele typhae]KAH9934510.1 hypothetical protein BXZ73DRAFT_100700 [Epithele typhae]
MQAIRGYWTPVSDPSNASNSLVVTRVSGSTAQFVFQGSSLEVWGAQIKPIEGPNDGSSYTIDGDKATVTNFQDLSNINDGILHNWTGSDGTHTLTIENDGATLGIDFFRIGSPTVTSPDSESSTAFSSSQSGAQTTVTSTSLTTSSMPIISATSSLVSSSLSDGSSPSDTATYSSSSLSSEGATATSSPTPLTLSTPSNTGFPVSGGSTNGNHAPPASSSSSGTNGTSGGLSKNGGLSAGAIAGIVIGLLLLLLLGALWLVRRRRRAQTRSALHRFEPRAFVTTSPQPHAAPSPDPLPPPLSEKAEKHLSMAPSAVTTLPPYGYTYGSYGAASDFEPSEYDPYTGMGDPAPAFAPVAAPAHPPLGHGETLSPLRRQSEDFAGLNHEF